MQATTDYIKRLHLIVESSLPGDLMARQAVEQLKNIALHHANVNERTRERVCNAIMDCLTAVSTAFVESTDVKHDRGNLIVLEGRKK